MATLRGDGDMWPQNRWYGLFVPGTNVNDFTALAGQFETRPSTASYFVKLNSTFDVSTLNRYGDLGYTPFLTVEPWNWQNRSMDLLPQFSLASYLSGDHDGDLKRIAGHIRDYDKPVYVRWAHEMNGHWYPWSPGLLGNTAQQYIDVWKHVRDIFSIAPKIKWVWACASIQGLHRDAPKIETLWPGDDLVDYAGTTGYAWDVDATATYTRTFERLASFTDKPFLIPEMGASTVNRLGVTGAAWTRSLADYLRATPRIQGFVWFQIHGAYTTGDYRLDEATIAALNETLAAVPILSNDASAPLDTPQANAVRLNPSTGDYAQEIVRGHACDPAGPKRGFDRRGVQYECTTHPRGWSNWRRLKD